MISVMTIDATNPGRDMGLQGRKKLGGQVILSIQQTVGAEISQSHTACKEPCLFLVCLSAVSSLVVSR